MSTVKQSNEHVSEPIHAAVPEFVILNQLEQLRVPIPNYGNEHLDAFLKECREAAAIKPGTTTEELIQEYKALKKLGLKNGHPDYLRVHTRLWAINTLLGDALWYDMIKEAQEKELNKQNQGEEEEEDEDEECDCEGGCEECYIHDPADYN